MKKFLLCTFTVVLFAGCSEEPADNQVVRLDCNVAFTASTEYTDGGQDSRAGYDGLKSIWHDGDELGVSFDATNNNLQFKQTAGTLTADGTSVRYAGSLVQPLTGEVLCVAYYPYAADAVVSGKVVTTVFPDTQLYLAGGYKDLPLFASYSGDIDALKLQFRNLFSVIKLSVAKDPLGGAPAKLQRIVFQGNNEETVAGPLTVDMSGSTPVVSFTGNGKRITYDCGEGVELSTMPQIFYIAIPSIEYSKGYSFNFKTDQGQMKKTARSGGTTPQINTVYSVPSLELDNLVEAVVVLDPNLREALVSAGLAANLDPVSGEVMITSAGKTATTLNVSGKGIASLAGIENFPALLELNASNNQLSSVNLSANTALTKLNLSSNDLTSLHLAANTALTDLNVSSNQLTGLDVSSNTALQNLDVSGNLLSGELSLLANTELLTLDVSTNQLTKLNVSKNTLLTTLKAYGNNLDTLDISGLRALDALYLSAGSPTLDSISSLKLTIPADAVIKNFKANDITLGPWLTLEVKANPFIESLSVRSALGLLGVTANDNTKLLSLDVTGSPVSAVLNTLGNAAGFQVIGRIL